MTREEILEKYPHANNKTETLEEEQTDDIIEPVSMPYSLS